MLSKNNYMTALVSIYYRNTILNRKDAAMNITFAATMRNIFTASNVKWIDWSEVKY